MSREIRDYRKFTPFWKETTAGGAGVAAMDDLQFMDGLLWYLKTRNWAFAKIESMSKGSQEPLDIQMYHYLYFANLLGAVDYVRDYFDCSDIITVFEMQLGEDNYSYIRELRNSVVHRGFNPTALAGVTDENHLFVFCPRGSMIVK